MSVLRLQGSPNQVHVVNAEDCRLYQQGGNLYAIVRGSLPNYSGPDEGKIVNPVAETAIKLENNDAQAAASALARARAGEAMDLTSSGTWRVLETSYLG